jgi:hypothetical protein
MDLNSEHYREMRMWHAENKVRVGSDEMPGPIPWERVNKGVFVFLGKRQSIDGLDYDAVLTDMDRLLPLFMYVASSGATQPMSTPSGDPFEFCPAAWSDRASSTVATTTQVQLDVVLRHNEIQKTLYHRLVSQYGYSNVSFENTSGVGTRVDIVVRREDEYWFYEIKTAQSPRACLREGIGQLLEYAFWPSAPNVTRLVVVGETPIDNDGAEYLRRLKEVFSLPIEYETIHIQPSPEGRTKAA